MNYITTRSLSLFLSLGLLLSFTYCSKPGPGEENGPGKENGSGTESNCTYLPVTADIFVSVDEGSGTIKVTENTTCKFTAQSNADWLSIAVLDGAVNYKYTKNTDKESRVATITIANQVAHVTQAGTEPSQLSIATFQGNKKAAVILTFDDALPSHPVEVRALLNKYGLKATFYVVTNPNRIKSDAEWAIWKDMDGEGHEIGNHSFSHNGLPWTASNIQTEIVDPYNTIVSKIGHCYTWAYPFGLDGKDDPNPHADPNPVVAQYHLASRYKTDPSGADYIPYIVSYDGLYADNDPATPAAYPEHLEDDINTVIAGKQIYDKTKLPDGNDVGFVTSHVLSTLTHATTLAKDAGFYNPIDLGILDKNFQYLKSKESEVWVCTYVDNFRYWKEKNNAIIKTILSTTNFADFVVDIAPSLDKSKYITPLTIVLDPPGNTIPVNPTVTRDAGGILPVVSVSGDKILVTVTPGAEAIHVKWGN